MCQVYAARVRVDGVAKVAELEVAEKEKMKAKVAKILNHNINVFINRSFSIFFFKFVVFVFMGLEDFLNFHNTDVSCSGDGLMVSH